MKPPPPGLSKTAPALLGAGEGLEEAFEAWLASRQEHAAMRERYAAERKRLEEHGAFLVGAVRAAGEPKPEGAALARGDGLGGFLREAEEKLAAARASLEEQQRREEASFAEALARVRSEVRARVERFASMVRPKLEVFLRPAGPERRILHVARVSPDEAVLLLSRFLGKLPSRYGFLFDDSTEDVALPPPPLYPDEGVSELRPAAGALAARLRAEGEVAPIKGFLPLLVGESLFRLLARGPVLEVELQDGDGFRNLLTPEEAERFAGHLLRLKLEGRIELELKAG